MGILHKKKPTAIIEKGIIEDKNGKKYTIFYVVISPSKVRKMAQKC